MNVTEIISAFKRPMGTFPLEAVQAAVADPEAVTQGLLNELKHAIQNPDTLLKDEEYMGHLFAMYLLAQFREERAYPLIVDFISLDPETVDLLLGDTVTEGLAAILASVCGGNIEPLKQVIEDENIYELVRSTTIKTIAILVAKDVIARDVALDYFKSLYSKLRRDSSEEVPWSYLVFYSNELYPDTLYAEIKQAFKDDLVDPWVIRLKHVDEQLKLGQEKALENLRADRFTHFIDDTIAEMQSWYSFRRNEPARAPTLSDTTLYTRANGQVVREGRKIGRNEPCPCGSGKKYKRCHGKKQ